MLILYTIILQVRIEGHVEQVPDAISDELFDKRSFESQINVHCSSQSERISTCHILKEREFEKRKIYQSDNIPRPHSLYLLNKVTLT